MEPGPDNSQGSARNVPWRREPDPASREDTIGAVALKISAASRPLRVDLAAKIVPQRRASITSRSPDLVAPLDLDDPGGLFLSDRILPRDFHHIVGFPTASSTVEAVQGSLPGVTGAQGGRDTFSTTGFTAQHLRTRSSHRGPSACSAAATFVAPGPTERVSSIQHSPGSARQAHRQGHHKGPGGPQHGDWSSLRGPCISPAVPS